MSAPPPAKLSARVVPDKAGINCEPVGRARGTMGQTQSPNPQTRLETNVTGIAQNRIIRPMSLNTFTYLRAHSAHFLFYVEGKKGGINGGRGPGVGVCVGGVNGLHGDQFTKKIWHLPFGFRAQCVGACVCMCMLPLGDEEGF